MLLLCGSNKIPLRPGFCMVQLWAVDHYMKINLIIHRAAETAASEACSCKVAPMLRFQLMGACVGSSASAQPNPKRPSLLIHLSNKSDSGLQSTSSSELVYCNKSREVSPFRAIILSRCRRVSNKRYISNTYLVDLNPINPVWTWLHM